MSSRESLIAISNISKVVIITVIGLAILIGGAVWVALQPTSLCGDGNVCTVTLDSVHLRSGTTASNSSLASSDFTFALTNPGPTTYISSISLWGGNIVEPVTYWSESSNKSGIVVLDEQTTVTWNLGNGTTTPEVEQLDQAAHSGNGPTQLKAITINQSFTFFPVTGNESIQIMKGQSYNFVINFVNGQSVSWNVVALS